MWGEVEAGGGRGEGGWGGGHLVEQCRIEKL